MEGERNCKWPSKTGEDTYRVQVHLDILIHHGFVLDLNPCSHSPSASLPIPMPPLDQLRRIQRQLLPTHLAVERQTIRQDRLEVIEVLAVLVLPKCPFPRLKLGDIALIDPGERADFTPRVVGCRDQCTGADDVAQGEERLGPRTTERDPPALREDIDNQRDDDWYENVGDSTKDDGISISIGETLTHDSPRQSAATSKGYS